MAARLQHVSEVPAPPEQVWATLTDLDGWQAWNPTLVEPRGELVEGSVVRMKLNLGRVKMPMKQKIVEVKPPSVLRWQSRFGPTWLFLVTQLITLLTLMEALRGGRGAVAARTYVAATALLGMAMLVRAPLADIGNTPSGIAPLRDVVDAACRDVGRDPADVERTVAVLVRFPGGTGRIQGSYAEAPPPPLEGSTEVLADALRGYAAEGVGHVQLVLDPITRGSIEAFAPVLRLLDA